MKKLVKKYDFFLASGPNMPAVATTFGKVLGPVGKMPSPQLGILPSEDEKMIEANIMQFYWKHAGKSYEDAEESTSDCMDIYWDADES